MIFSDGFEPNCPHCDASHDGPPAGGEVLRRCDGCGFVYPSAAHPVEEPFVRDRDLVPADRYRLVAPLGAQDSARVYLARHLGLDEPCVVKVLSTSDPSCSPDARRRFHEEAKAGFRIKHPNVARVLDCDQSGHAWYFVMEYVDGANLLTVLDSVGPLPWMQVLDVAQQASKGLSAIHRAGLLHRDIKPSNLILGADGVLRISDLGFVDILHHAKDREPASFGLGNGSPRYMPPEQLFGHAPLDQRADIYALGATMYHLLVGHQRHRGGGPLAYLAGEDAHAPTDWPRGVTPPIPKWFRRIVEKCIQSDADQRYDSADDLLGELSDWSQSETVSTPSAVVPGVGVPKGVVVLPFDNLTSDAAHDWVGNALAEEVHNTLVAIDGVQMVDRHEVLSLLGRMYVDHPADVTTAQLRDAARRVGAAVVVRGSFQVNSGRVKVTASRLDDDHPGGKPLATIRGSSADIIELQSRVGREVVSALGYQCARGDDDLTADGSEADPHLVQCYAQAQSAFSAGQYGAGIAACRSGLESVAGSVELLSLMGVCHSRLGEYESAIECHRQLESIAEDRDDPYRLVEARANLGVMYYYMSEYPRAYEFLESSGRLASELNLLSQLAKNCSNMGFVLSKMERLADADRAFEEAIRIKLSLGATASLVSPYNGRGEIAMQQGRYPDALAFYRQALVWAEELGDHVNTGICHTHLGRCLFHSDDPRGAEHHLRVALEALSSTEFWNGMAVAYEQLAELHLSRQQSDPAFKCIEKRIDLARRHSNRYIEASAWEQKARVYELADEKDQAMECLRKSFQLQQSKSPYESRRGPSRSRPRR
jgi:tetratricopeptide (TPR) repeat protein